MPPLFKFNCKMGGVDVPGVCYFENPEPHCGYDAFSCVSAGVFTTGVVPSSVGI